MQGFVRAKRRRFVRSFEEDVSGKSAYVIAYIAMAFSGFLVGFCGGWLLWG